MRNGRKSQNKNNNKKKKRFRLSPKNHRRISIIMMILIYLSFAYHLSVVILNIGPSPSKIHTNQTQDGFIFNATSQNPDNDIFIIQNLAKNSSHTGKSWDNAILISNFAFNSSFNIINSRFYLIFENCQFSKLNILQNSTNVLINKCDFSKSILYLENSSKNKINQCKFSDSNSNLNLMYSSENNITNNYFLNIRDDFALDLVHSNYNLIIGNEFRKISSVGSIDLVRSDSNQVSNNRFKLIHTIGMLLSHAENNTISENTFTDIWQTAIMYNSQIEEYTNKNTIVNNKEYLKGFTHIFNFISSIIVFANFTWWIYDALTYINRIHRKRIKHKKT